MPGPDRNVRPDLDPKRLTTIKFLKFFFEKLILKKVNRRQQKHENLTSKQ